MNDPHSGNLYSPISISKELWPWCLGLICILTMAWTGVAAWIEASSGKHDGLLQIADAVVSKSSAAIPLHIVYSISIVASVNFVKGGGIMVTARALDAYFKERLRRRRERLREEGRAEGRAEFADWLRRREEAEARGEDFDEPPPGS